MSCKIRIGGDGVGNDSRGVAVIDQEVGGADGGCPRSHREHDASGGNFHPDDLNHDRFVDEEELRYALLLRSTSVDEPQPEGEGEFGPRAAASYQSRVEGGGGAESGDRLRTLESALEALGSYAHSDAERARMRQLEELIAKALQRAAAGDHGGASALWLRASSMLVDELQLAAPKGNRELCELLFQAHAITVENARLGHDARLGSTQSLESSVDFGNGEVAYGSGANFDEWVQRRWDELRRNPTSSDEP
jgi:hypothetical protein